MFLWFHVRYLNCKGVKLSRITKGEKKLVKIYIMMGLNFLF